MLGSSDKKNLDLNATRKDSGPKHPTNVEKPFASKIKNKKKKQHKNVYILEYYWGYVVSYVVKDSWTKRNQFTVELLLHSDKFMEMRSKHKKQELTHFFGGPTATEPQLHVWSTASILPTPSVD